MHTNTAPLARTIPDACHRLSIGRTMLYKLIKAGEIRTVKIGTRTLVPEADLQKVIADRLAVGA